MSNASELAKLASSISVTNRGREEGANTVAVDSFSVKKLTITDGRSGNGAFDGGNTAYPAIELLSSGMNSSTFKYTPSIKFGSTDAQFVTQNPKFGAAIVAQATQNYTTDSTGGMALSFWTSPVSPGPQSDMRERVRIESSGQITLNTQNYIIFSNAAGVYGSQLNAGAGIGKISDNRLVIYNYDDSDITFLRSGNAQTARIFGANGDVSISNSLTVDDDLLFNSGFGSAAKAFGCRAWANFNGTGSVAIRGNGNVTSVTDNGTGNYTINFTNAMIDANYAVVVGAGGLTLFGQQTIAYILSGQTASAVTIITCDDNAATTAQDATTVNVCIFR